MQLPIANGTIYITTWAAIEGGAASLVERAYIARTVHLSSSESYIRLRKRPVRLFHKKYIPSVELAEANDIQSAAKKKKFRLFRHACLVLQKRLRIDDTSGHI
jgi:UV DNA damage repair endonuclease